MKTLTLNMINNIKLFFDTIFEWFFNAFIYFLRPGVRYIFNKYRKFKKYSVRKQKRIKRDLLRNATVLGISCILGLIIAFSVNGFTQNVKAEDNDMLHKYYTFYTVEPGDTLWDVADVHYELGYKNHSDYIDEVMFINHLKNKDDIICGDTLVIPYYSYKIK